MSSHYREPVASPHRPGIEAMSRCVGRVDDFLTRYWTRVPFHWRAPGRGDFTDLLSSHDVDRILSTTPASWSKLKLIKDSEPLDPAQYLQITNSGAIATEAAPIAARIYEHFQEGATISISSLQEYWPPLATFCRALELFFTHPVQANAYATPRHSQGSGLHYDTHDVFVLQVSGRKDWRVHEPIVVHPLPSQVVQPVSQVTKPLLQIELCPGDVLYVPHGFLHSAKTTDDVSIHVTIGVLCYTWHDMISEMVAHALNHAPFRQPLPVGFAREGEFEADDVKSVFGAFAEWFSAVDINEIGGLIKRKFWSTRTHLPIGHLEQLSQLPLLTDSSIVKRHPGRTCWLEIDADRCSVSAIIGGGELVMPIGLAPVMRKIFECETLKVADLADYLEEESRLALIRHLVREGLFTVEVTSTTLA
jgi:bifunctional lysine-specific demethylase and histidyl-hydroxylase NO66